ncbi:putative zinc protease [bacterium HR08]|nr:putative zinc protease [bacterium HR08]
MSGREILAGIMMVALAAVARAQSQLVPPPLRFQVTTLKNGLRVITHEDHSAPVINLQVWYHVGSKDERPGRTGFAHLFEHLMFKGSKNVGPEEHTELIKSIGGMDNAYTTEDVTVYWQTFPSNYLEMVLWLEADRMASLAITEENFRSEREVVKEERRLRVENPPYGRVIEVLYANAFEVHPYRHIVIGSMDDLNAATVEDVREFFETYYVPNNATLVIVGDFDTRQALAWVEQYFGNIPRGKRPIPRVTVKEPPKTREKRLTERMNVPLPALLAGYYIPEDGHPDSYALKILSRILSAGQSSRLYRKLVYELRLAAAAFGAGNFTEHPNLFFAGAILNPGHTPEAAEKAIVEELERLKREPVPARELEKAKNQMIAEVLFARQSNQGKADALGRAAVLGKDPARVNTEVERLLAVTPEEIQRVARRYFTETNRIVLTILPQQPEEKRPGP